LIKFSQAFNLAKPLFNFIDVGPGKEHADHKLREYLRLYLSNVQCKRVYFAGCHDTGYIPVLEEYSSDTTQATKITLIETRNYDRRFTRLGLGKTSMEEVFDAVLPPDVEATTSRGGPQIVRSIAEPSITAATSPPVITMPLSPRTQPTATASYAKVGRAAQSNTPAVLSIAPSKSTEPMKFLMLNASDQRIDQVLPKFTPIASDTFNKKVDQNGQNFCNRFHIGGRCSIVHCSHVHGPRLSGPILLVLKHRARAQHCASRTNCYDIDCTSAHHCIYGAARCFGNCGLTDTHNMDLVGRVSSFISTYADSRTDPGKAHV
jgi:hypothetical protein